MTEEDKEKYKWLLEMQSPSTRRAMLRPESEDINWLNRPIPQEAIAVPDAKTDDERVAPRSISFKEAIVESNLRYERGQYLAEMRNEPDANSVDAFKREIAIEAFREKLNISDIKAKFKSLAIVSGLAELRDMVWVKNEK